MLCSPEYLKVIHNLLVDNGNLFRERRVRQLTELSQKALMEQSKIPDLNNHFGATLPIDCEKDCGLRGLLRLIFPPGWRSTGTMTWTGLPRLCCVLYRLPSRVEHMTDWMLFIY